MVHVALVMVVPELTELRQEVRLKRVTRFNVVHFRDTGCQFTTYSLCSCVYMKNRPKAMLNMGVTEESQCDWSR